MRAVIQNGYGRMGSLTLGEVATPVPGAGEVLVRIHAASMHPDIWHMLEGRPYALRLMGGGLRRPRNPIPGIDVAGVVEALGPDVTEFAVGERVFGETVDGHQWKNGGAFAEFAAVSVDALARVPESLTLVEAAAVPTSGLIALRSLRDEGGLDADQRVLINGAGGGVGTFAVQIAKAFGAHVTAVDDGAKLGMLGDIGADVVVDYTAEDFTQRGERYDLLLDVACRRPFSELRPALVSSGSYIMVGHDHYGAGSNRWIGSIARVVRHLLMSPFAPQLRGLWRAKRTHDPLGVLVGMIGAGEIRPVIDSTYPLERVAEAVEYMTSAQAEGKVVIVLDGG